MVYKAKSKHRQNTVQNLEDDNSEVVGTEKSDLKVSEKDVLLEEPIREVPRVQPAMVALALV